MRSPKKRTYLLFIVALVFIPVFLLGLMIFDVIHDTSTRIQKGAIDVIIDSESPVYYDDGKTPIGVFFDKTHRKHVHYDEIPKDFIKALVAAEDGDFFSHRGVDIKAITRAFISNIRSGKVVQGGSTITQQTAKNIFKRERRSYRAKLKELIQAFLLEKEYSKEEILEMYINQFFVTGYGKGLGIAARYFFDKEVKDLDLVEAAFIAGLVKGPNRYNPFIKKTEADRNQAIVRAQQRKNYVLKNMLKLNFISRQQYQEATKRDIPFQEGTVTYRLNVILDHVREQLESDYFQNILKEQGVDNVAASGIKIYTSINKEIQRAALKSLRNRLPVMDVTLNGYDQRELPDTYRDLFKRRSDSAESGLPFLAKITHVAADAEYCQLVVTWDHGGGFINYEGIKPMGEAWQRWKTGDTGVFDQRQAQQFLKNFQVGDMIPVQRVSSPDRENETRLRLSRIPELEGGLIVLQNGMIKAMVGGYLDRFFNRAMDAKRQLGSIFKPIIYTAALQLKWNSLDPLMNIRDLFQFENTFYLPNPDHEPRSNRVSMVWAGAGSENLATVWLLYHLTDHLNMSEFRLIAGLVGLERKDGESYLEYKERIRDQYGVVVNISTLRQAAFAKAVKEVISDIIFSGHVEMLYNIKRLHYRMDRTKLDSDDPEERKILALSFERYHALNMNMKTRYHDITQALEQLQIDMTPKHIKDLSSSLTHFYRTENNSGRERIIYTEAPQVITSISLVPLTPEWILNQDPPITPGEVWVDGLFTSSVLDLIQENTNENLKSLLTYKRYDMDVLFWVRDFRSLVNLLYVVRLSKQMGISTKLEPVLSFPLGPNAVSISEAALVYQTIMTGQVFPITPDEGLSMVPVITKIVDREGDILWELKPNPVQVVSDRVSVQVTEILRKVMETGTGRRARDAVQAFGIPIPSFGKTGTANRFTNSSFVGFIPGFKEETGQFDIHSGYVIASYVGYDNNKSMKSKHAAIYGASGALPLWIDTAQAIVDRNEYRDNIQLADMAFDPASGLLSGHTGLVPVPVSPTNGLPLDPSVDLSKGLATQVLADVVDKGDRLELNRHFEPIGGGFE